MNNNKTRRGRPTFPVNLPSANEFTINDLAEANPHITCRLTLYTKRNKLVKSKVIQLTKKTVPTGGVGKPLAVYVKTAHLARCKAAYKAALTRKAATAPQPVTDATTESVPAADVVSDTTPEVAAPVNA